MSLIRQFALMACAVVCAGMIMLGSFVSAEIQRSVVHNAAVGMSLYVNSLARTYLDELTSGSEMSPASLEMLDASFTATELGHRIISVKIWRPDGSIIYSTPRDLIGTDFATNTDVQNALKGQVSARFGIQDDPESLAGNLNVPLLKMYAPIRGKGADQIVAVAAFFARGDLLEATLETARLRSWIAVAGGALLQFALLYGIVWRGGKTIDMQRATIVGAHRAMLEANERFLRRISADLHDGPAQLLSLGLLRLNGLRSLLAPEHAKSAEFERIKTSLQEGLRELRQVAAGLAPPHLESLPLEKVLELVVHQHEQRTSSTVDAVIGTLTFNVSLLYKVAIYRFVQQGLHNAYRHAGGIGQRVHAFSNGSTLAVEVSDKGPGFSPSEAVDGERLGLAGMRDRIESLGGTFSLETKIGSGTTLRAIFRVADLIIPEKADEPA